MDILRLSYWADSDGTGELKGAVEAQGFAGCGSAWFNPSEIRDFCRQLDRYPIPKGEPIKLAGGFWDSGGGVLETTNLSISIAPQDSFGALRIEVEVADDDERRVRTWFVASYEDVGRFQGQLRRLVEGTLAEAALIGTRT